MTSTRRDLFKFAGGAALGVALTPAPWRLVTDTALWSETWPGVPRNARGEIRARYTNCSLCPAGCAMRARCVGDQPVSLTGVAGHPFTRGALCPFGLAAHHLPYHPARLKQESSLEASHAIRQAIAACGPTEQIALLDLRPHRTASWTFRRAMARLPNGVYCAPASPFGEGVAVNLAAARTVVSFGAPLLDGWGTPGNVLALRDGFQLIQVEAVESRTAVMADRWIPLPSGLELGQARDIIAAQSGPALILDAHNRPEILSLNQPSDVLVSRRETPVPEDWKAAAPATTLEALPDRSIRLLFIDESAPDSYLPWSAIERKLVADNPLVVVFAWSSDGYARHAHFVLPAAVFPEAVDDIPAALDSPAAMFRISAALVAAPPNAVNAAQFVAALAGLDATNALPERAAAIHKAGRGTLFTCADAKSTPLKEMKPDEFWKALNEGATWIDDLPAHPPAPKLAFAGASTADPTEDDLPLAVVMAEARPTPGSPILSKLYQESNLRLGPDCAALHPSTAEKLGVSEGGSAILQTRCGKLTVRVTLDTGTPPGVVQIASGPRTLDLCGSSPRAKVVRV